MGRKYGNHILLVVVLGVLGLAMRFPNPSIRIFVWMDPECPISQKMTKSVRELDISKLPCQVVLVFPRNEKAEINRFRKKYQLLDLDYKIDSQGSLTTAYHVTTTPEVRVVNEKDSVLYGGAIDNSFPSIGIFKSPTEFYLANALKDIAQGTRPSVAFVKPVGCLIQLQHGL